MSTRSQGARATRTDDVSATLASVTGHLGFAFGFSAVVNTLFLASPLFMMQLYGRVLDSRSVDTLVSLSIGLVLALVAMAGADAARGRLLARAGARVDRRLTPSAALATIDEGKGQTSRALEDVDAVRRFLAGGAMTTLMDTPFTLMFLGVLFLLHPALGLVASFGAVAILVTIGIARLVETPRENRVNDGTREIARVSAGLEEDSGEIRALGLQGGLARRIASEQDGVGATRLSIGELSGSVGAVTRFIRMAAHSGALATGAFLALNGQMSPAAMFAAAILAGRALGPIEALPNAWRHARAAQGAVDRLRKRLEGAAADAPAAQAAPRPGAAVQVARLVAAKPGGMRPVLRSISFAVAPGEVVLVAGPTGAGKSTLARCLVGAERPKSGEVRIDGADIASLDPAALAARIGWLPQDLPLFPGTVRENIARFAPVAEDAVLDAATRAGTRAAIERLPRGFETEVEPGGRNLSPGLRQGIALARALQGSPGLMVLDQPTAHMDVEGEVAMINLIRRLKAEGVSVVLISHKPVLAALADRIMLLEDGQVEILEDRAKVVDAMRRQSVRSVGPSAVPAPAVAEAGGEAGPAAMSAAR